MNLRLYHTTFNIVAFCCSVNPSSSVFSYAELELIEKGADTNVTADNVDSYLDNCIDFFLVDGIRNQVVYF